VRRDRRGMTLIEVMIALVILTGALLSLGSFVTNFTHTVATSGVRTTAGELAADRIETVKSAVKYDSLETLYAGTEATVTGHPGFSRQTIIQRVGGVPGDSVDYKIVTVVVSNQALRAPVRKTTIIADF
jgi:prepilin-type N-terminal cleavage/methylation domain-containing protein